MKYLLLPLAALLPACAAQVSHPTKSVAEMQVDIDFCTDEANRKNRLDAVAALYEAYDCLEAKGYQRGGGALGAKVEKTLGEKGPKERGPVPPCAVPCRRPAPK